MKLKSIDDLQLDGKKVLLRVDFNVPVKDGKVTDDTRIRAALPTISKIINEGGSVILMSHFGRPKEGPEEKFSLKQIVAHLSDCLDKVVEFSPETVGAVAKSHADRLQKGAVLLLENTRFHIGETKGDKNFARELAELGDLYVNDAFGTAHRAHASTAVVAEFFESENRAAGYLMVKEVENAQKILSDHKKPFVAILGGAKVSDKINLIENLTDTADHILIGGGMAYTFIKANGGSIGDSLLEPEMLELCKNIQADAASKGCQIHLPVDTVIADSFSEKASYRTVKSNEIPEAWIGLDIGFETVANYEQVIQNASTILWNGPMGVFEMRPFSKGTESVAYAVAAATEKGAFSLVGGGDSVAAVNQFGLNEKISFVSTGGGALLEFFEGKILPGVKVLEAN